MFSRQLLAAAWLVFALATAEARYAFDANGRPARIETTWELRRDDHQPIDILTSLARCGPRLFVSDTQSHVFQLDTSAAQPLLRVFASEEQGIGRPTALAADCSTDRLYVLNAGLRTIVELNARTGAVVSTRSFKRDLYEARALIVDADAYYIGGVWNADPANSLPKRDVDSFFDSTWLGERVSRDSDSVTGALAVYAARCIAASACTFGSLDRIPDGGSSTWIAAHGASTDVALYDRTGHRTATFDATSPKFQRDGTTLAVATPQEAAERWKSRNSLIRYVFATAKYLAVVHTLTMIGPDWRFGQQTDFSIFMNVYAPDGSGLVSDIKLPGLPIGRDDTRIYVVDYGERGRRASDQLTLAAIPVTTGDAAVR
jgi:hypothetical protein